MTIEKKSLVDILGEGKVHDDETTLNAYAQDQSFSPGGKPDFVVLAEKVEDVQQVVKLANETRTPLTPYSSGLNLHGAALAANGGIIINLSRMNKILTIDEDNWFVIIEPGVTFQQLQDHLMEKGFRVMVPFGVPPGRSVLTSYLERDPVLAAASFEYGNHLIMDTELVLPHGEVFRTGLWSAGGKPGGAHGPVRNVIFRLWTAAQGTLGILTKMGMHMDPFIKERKIFFICFRELAEAIEPIKRIQRKEIGMECFLLNRFNLASMLSKEWGLPERFPAKPKPSASFEQMRSVLPAWVLCICIQGAPRHPEKKIAYEEAALQEIGRSLNLEVKESLDPAPDLHQMLLHEIIYPWGILKKFNYRGSVHDLSFKSPLGDIPVMESVIQKACNSGNYDPQAIGAYVLPVERGRAVHCEFDLHCDLEDAKETQSVKELWLKASQDIMNQGACFDRPYGIWADLVYPRAGIYTEKLKQVKAEMDPHGIMNPGKLCFK